MLCPYLPLLLWTTGWFFLSEARQTERLSYYETLRSINLSVKTRVRRSSASNATLMKELHFKAFQRNFHLSLTSGSPVLARDFQARLVYGDGSSTHFSIDQSQIFTGHVVSSRGSAVSAFREGAMWNIHIIENEETYTVEPAWRLLSPLENPHNDTMITYRLSDLRDLPNKSSFCGKPPDLNTSPVEEDLHLLRNQSKRSRVQTRRKRGVVAEDSNTCTLHLVCDTYTFNSRCRRDYSICSALLIAYIQVTDKLFRSSRFESGLGNYLIGIGLQVGRITIHADHHAKDPLSMHYNEKRQFNAPDKLDAFSEAMASVSHKFCLHHLISEFADPTGILGRAYTAVLCRGTFGGRKAYNTGITSGIDTHGRMLPSLLSIFVYAHETGHNFGSTHDPDNYECAPSDERGGKFLMWSYAVSGESPNNRRFSNCSLRTIGRQIPARCFRARSRLVGFCGNGLVDSGEECDAGAHGLDDLDKCCDSHCRLRSFAECSERNSECCSKCKVASAGTLCRSPGYFLTCAKKSYCTGNSTVCPPSETEADGEKCGPAHVCYQGICESPCKTATSTSEKGEIFLPCSCKQTLKHLCMYCCFDATDVNNPGKCTNFSSLLKEDGSPCEGGLCSGGVCNKDYSPSQVLLLETYIGFVERSSFRQFLSANLVTVVIVLSLLAWVPITLVIHHYDEIEKEEREEEMELLAQQIQMKELKERFSMADAKPTEALDSPVDSNMSFVKFERSKHEILDVKPSQRGSDV